MSTRSRIAVLSLLVAFVLACVATVVWRETTLDETANRVRLSADGVRWTSTYDDAVVASEDPWTPGQTRTAVFFVRNDADVRADVIVAVALTSEGGGAGSALRVSASVGDGDAQFFVPERQVNAVRVGELDPGQRATVTLRAAFFGTEALDSSAVRYGISGSGTRAPGSSSSFDSTGANLALAPIFLGVALLLTAYVMHRSRHPRPASRRRP